MLCELAVHTNGVSCTVSNNSVFPDMFRPAFLWVTLYIRLPVTVRSLSVVISAYLPGATKRVPEKLTANSVSLFFP